MIDEYNKQGWKVVQFQYTRPNLSIGRWFVILLVMIITLGFFSYWIGVSIIFEKTGLESEGNKFQNKRKKVSSVDVLSIPEKDLGTQEFNNDFDTDIEALSIIINKTKSALFSKFNDEIVEHIESICTSKEKAIQLISDFESQTGNNLLKELGGLSSNYDNIKSYLSV